MWDFFEGDENDLKLMQRWLHNSEYTKKYTKNILEMGVHFILYPNKAVFKVCK